MPRLIKSDRILYLDSDIIVNGDLNPFLELEIAEPYALAMTLDIKYMEAYSSGVILIDRARWQQYQLEEACRQIIRQEIQITNGDQTVINLACRDYVQELPTYYNNQVGYDMISSYGRMKPPFEELLDDQALITHFLTPDKPWNLLSFGRQRELW
ncbi:Glycosyltransferase GlyE [Enterococcus cecorum]|nr:Glycosyltransferase GlyE [Enterococcus cecorum]